MRLFFASGTTSANIGPSTEVEIDMQTDGYLYPLEILRIMVRHVGGNTSGHFHFKLGDKAGFIDNSINQMFQDGTVNKSALMDIVLNTSTTKSSFCKTSPNGKMYVRFEPSSGTDNQFQYLIFFRRL